MTKEEQKTMLQYWIPLIVAVGGALVTWGILSQKVADAETQIATVQGQYNSMEASVVQTQVDVASIKSSVNFLVKQYQK